MKRVPAFLSQSDKNLRLLISTEKRDNIVIVMVEEIEVATESAGPDTGALRSA